MSDVFDRLEQGQQDTTTRKHDDWNEMVGTAPTSQSTPIDTTTYTSPATATETGQGARGMAGDMLNRFLNNKALMAGTAIAGAAFLARRSRQRKQQQ